MIRTSEASIEVELPRPSGFAALIRAVGGTLASSVLVFVIGLVTSVILNRSLGPDGKGIYATILTSAQLITLCASFGLAKAITYHMARDEEGRHKRFRTILTLALGSLVVSCTGIFLFSHFVHSGRLRDIFDGFTGPLMLLVALLLLNSYGLAALRGLRRFRETNLLQPLTNLAFLLLLGGAVFFAKLDLRAAVAAKIGAILLIVPLLIWCLRKQNFSFRPAFDKPMAKGLMGYGLGYFGYSVFQSFNYRFDIILVSSMTDSANTGYYATATGLAEILWFLPNAVGLVLLPMLAGQNKDSGDQMTARSCRLVLPLMTCGVIGLLAGGHLIVNTLYGAAFLPTVTVLYAMGFGIITNTIFSVLGTHLASRNRLRQLMGITASGFAVNVLLNLMWIPKWGIIGAALAGTVSYTTTATLTAVYFCRHTGIAPREFLLVKREELATLFQLLRQRLRNLTSS